MMPFDLDDDSDLIYGVSAPNLQSSLQMLSKSHNTVFFFFFIDK